MEALLLLASISQPACLFNSLSGFWAALVSVLRLGHSSQMSVRFDSFTLAIASVHFWGLESLNGKKHRKQHGFKSLIFP